MEQGRKYSINELLNNDEFIAWVTSNKEKNNHFWEKIQKNLKGEDKSNFKKAVVIIKKIKSLDKDHSKKISPEFIQQQYIRLLESKTKSNHKTQSKVIKWPVLLRYAAAVLLLFSISAFFYYQNANKNSFNQHLVAGNHKSPEVLLQVSENDLYKISEKTNSKWLTDHGIFISVDGTGLSFVATDDMDTINVTAYKLIVPKGKNYHLTMIDGTKVELNSNSTLSFNNSIISKQRNVSLKGEAFFDVTSNKKRPFTVNANNVIVKALGTEFNVSNYKENGYITTTLIEGSVKVSNPKGKETIIQPGEQATVYNDKNEIVVQQADVQEAVAWMAGRLIFNDEKLEDLVPRLNRWFDMEFVILDKTLNDYRFTGTLKKENDLTHYLQILNYTKGISYKIENNQVKLFINNNQ